MTLNLLEHAQSLAGGTQWGEAEDISSAHTFLNQALPRQLASLQEVCPRCQLALMRRPGRRECIEHPRSPSCWSAAALVCSHGPRNQPCNGTREDLSSGSATPVTDDAPPHPLVEAAAPPGVSSLDSARLAEEDGARLTATTRSSPCLAALSIRRGSHVAVVEWHVRMLAPGWADLCATTVSVWSEVDTEGGMLTALTRAVLVVMLARLLVGEAQDCLCALRGGASGMGIYAADVWNWVDWAYLLLPLLSVANTWLDYQLITPTSAHGLWGSGVVLLGCRFFGYAAVLQPYRLFVHTLYRARRWIANFLLSTLTITLFLATSAHMMFGHFSSTFASLQRSLHTVLAIMIIEDFEIPEEVMETTPFLAYAFFYLSTVSLIMIVSQLLIAILVESFDQTRAAQEDDIMVDSHEGYLLEALPGWRRVTLRGSERAITLRHLLFEHQTCGMPTVVLCEALEKVADADDETDEAEVMIGIDQLKQRLREVAPYRDVHAERIINHFGMVPLVPSERQHEMRQRRLSHQRTLPVAVSSAALKAVTALKPARSQSSPHDDAGTDSVSHSQSSSLGSRRQ